MPLHLDYRPANFDEVIGNEAAVASLKSLLARDDSPHAFLFTGPSGCGKTTLARLAAAALDCTEDNLREIDSADFRGIDTIRDLRQSMRLAGLDGGIRCYILDECHKMTNDAQNALLKALEDTPSHVYFFLCTTDPQKLIKTIKTRCTPFEVRSLKDSEITELVNWVCEQEDKAVSDEDVMDAIVKVADGSPRTALVALDKVIDLDDNDREAALAQIKSMEAETIELCRALLKRESWKRISSILGGLGDVPEETIRHAVLGYMNAVVLKGDNEQAFAVIEAFLDNFFDSRRAGLMRACREATK